MRVGVVADVVPFGDGPAPRVLPAEPDVVLERAPVGKNDSFTPFALATSIAALALSAPKVPHMSSIVMATRARVAGPVRIHGGSGVTRRWSGWRAASGGIVGGGGWTACWTAPEPHVAPPPDLRAR